MLVGALAVWDVVVFARRGWIAGRALRRLLPARRGDGSRLSGMRGGIDHVLCSAELQSSENLYFGRDFVYGYRFGVGSPGALPLYKAVRASSALPVAFPTFHLGASRFSFSYPAGESPPPEDRPKSTPRTLELTDGGVYDNMADQWPQGFENRSRSWPKVQDHHEPDTLIIANASAGLGFRPGGVLKIPAIGGLFSVLRVKDVLYDQTTALRRHGLVARFDRAVREGKGIRGALVHIPQSPFEVPLHFQGSTTWPDRAERAEAALAHLDNTPENRVMWAAFAKANAAVPTVLRSRRSSRGPPPGSFITRTPSRWSTST